VPVISAISSSASSWLVLIGRPVAPLYEAALDVAEVADQRCASGWDVYLRHVLGAEAPPDEDRVLERALQDAVRALVVRAKTLIYEQGRSRRSRCAQDG
jgi:CRISPR/Cas system-associated exonuclease Cas4 (RecB family)